jgi:Major Facilitator Superfamily
MQQVLDYEPLTAGLAYLPLAITIIVSAGVASTLVTRIGFKPTLIAGMLLIAAGLVWFAQVSAPGGTYVGDILFPSLLAAVGLGLAFVPTTIAALTGTRPDEAGLASGLINTSQQVGGALGLAILATVATGRTDDVIATGERNPAVALTEGFQDAFMVGAGMALLGALLAATLISSRDSREHAEAGNPRPGAPREARSGRTGHPPPTTTTERDEEPPTRFSEGRPSRRPVPRRRSTQEGDRLNPADRHLGELRSGRPGAEDLSAPPRRIRERRVGSDRPQVQHSRGRRLPTRRSLPQVARMQA